MTFNKYSAKKGWFICNNLENDQIVLPVAKTIIDVKTSAVVY